MVSVTIPNFVSTIIPVHNRPEMLVCAVESVLQQTYRPIEIILVDDGSTDETPDVCQEFVQQYPEIIRFEAQQNLGPGPAREKGRGFAQGEFVQYLDSDDLLLPNKFTDQVKALRENPECGIAYGITRLVDQDGIILADPFKWTGRNIKQLFPGLLVDRWWCTHTPLYRRELTDKIGPWSNMRWSQDWEYDSRAGTLETKLVSTGTRVSEHVHHDGVRQTSHASWQSDPIRLLNRLHLLENLWMNAKKAGVAVGVPARVHFSRWCFAIARQCSAQGMVKESTRLLELALEAAHGDRRNQLEIAFYRSLTRVIGHKVLGEISHYLSQRKMRVSSKTLQQSFENREEAG